MIRFDGNFSQECKKHIQKQHSKVAFAAALITSIIFSAILVAVSIVTGMWIIMSFEIALIYMMIVTAIPKVNTPDKQAQKYCVSMTIYPDSIDISSELVYQSRKIDDIKKIVDYGNWYQFYFYFSERSFYFICQKDRIVEGTIEDFEERFKEFIERK